MYLKPIKAGEFYLFILYLQLTKSKERFRVQKNKHRKNIMLVQVNDLKYNFSTKLYIYYKNNNTNKKINKDVIEISVIHILPVYP